MRIKNVKIILPPNAELLKWGDLDEALAQPLKRSDIALVIKCNKYVINIVIEDTGVPEPKDIQKLEASYNKLVEEEFFQSTKAIKMLLLHHRGGVHWTLKKLASRPNVEVLRCNEDIDLNTLLMRRGLKCQ
ncbi:hypothetical protein Igag_0778 [Ignisphaera aggregans DSM 17230]|uniref:Uncharacterized protein n=1 Tax=Ignisphaera aggregans (strain DSM 17230 / JCM 13409 / AQ1.S1) TaxID=583356 RepID=E0STC8_IGNAA|nr:hypothetical protein Igag_0778 [Ignisphaera aggregans DSM 17230]